MSTVQGNDKLPIKITFKHSNVLMTRHFIGGEVSFIIDA